MPTPGADPMSEERNATEALAEEELEQLPDYLDDDADADGDAAPAAAPPREARGRRLRVTDLAAFHRAFGAHRFTTERSARGTLSRAQLLEGASALLGDWFPEAYADDARRGWGIAFPTVEERAAHDPGRRL